MNKSVNIAIRTPVGKKDRQDIRNAITQDDVFAPLLPSKQVDTFGQECLDMQKYTCKYRGEVEIPPLIMVDDLLCISECGFETTMSHAYLTLKTDVKKLQFGSKKCKKIHIGKYCEKYKCQELKVDKWEELEIRNEETGMNDIKDVCNGTEIIEEKTEERYLGDLISADGKNIKNIKARVAKGTGVIIRILTILEGVPFGKFYFKIAMILRESLLVSSMIHNSEAWYNTTNREMDLLETVDLQFLRKVLNAPKSTPKEMLYLETGCIPFREIIRKRRILFLHYIVNESESSFLKKFLIEQIQTQKSKDWSYQVLKDIDQLGLDLTVESIKNMKKTRLKIMVNQAIKEKTFADLEKKKESHSKVKNIIHKRLEIQGYLKPNKIRMKNEEAQEFFRMRGRVTE